MKEIAPIAPDMRAAPAKDYTRWSRGAVSRKSANAQANCTAEELMGRQATACRPARRSVSAGVAFHPSSPPYRRPERPEQPVAREARLQPGAQSCITSSRNDPRTGVSTEG